MYVNRLNVVVCSPGVYGIGLKQDCQVSRCLIFWSIYKVVPRYSCAFGDGWGFMRNFEKLASDVDVSAMLAELSAKPELWLADTSRQKIAATQRETQSIYLRQFDGRLTAEGSQLPIISAWVYRYCQQQRGVLARVALAKLPPHGQVYRHVDGDGNSGDYRYYDYRDRIHLVLQSEAGTRFTCGDEEVHMQAGEIWWFDNKKPHEAFNESGRDRIHLIMDIRNRRSLWRGVRRKIMATAQRMGRGATAAGRRLARRVLTRFPARR